MTDQPLAEKERVAIAEPVVVNDAFVRRFFPSEDPIGKRFCIDPTNKTYWYTIVGVVGDMRRQGMKLMDMMAVAVGSLDKLDRIIPAVRALGQRHVAYGVREEHYDIVGAALLWTLEQGLGDAWTVELASAWATAYTLLATTMKDAAAEIDAVAV